MNLKVIFITSFNTFFKWRKAKLVTALIALRNKYFQFQDRVNKLEKENTLLTVLIEMIRSFLIRGVVANAVMVGTVRVDGTRGWREL